MFDRMVQVVDVRLRTKGHALLETFALGDIYSLFSHAGQKKIAKKKSKHSRCEDFCLPPEQIAYWFSTEAEANLQTEG